MRAEGLSDGGGCAGMRSEGLSDGWRVCRCEVRGAGRWLVGVQV